ncbi:hypothetical protein J0S82_004457, partial [Galemys pyrenaicus]
MKKVDAVQKRASHTCYHSNTGRGYNVTQHAIGIDICPDGSQKLVKESDQKKKKGSQREGYLSSTVVPPYPREARIWE